MRATVVGDYCRKGFVMLLGFIEYLLYLPILLLLFPVVFLGLACYWTGWLWYALFAPKELCTVQPKPVYFPPLVITQAGFMCEYRQFEASHQICPNVVHFPKENIRDLADTSAWPDAKACFSEYGVYPQRIMGCRVYWTEGQGGRLHFEREPRKTTRGWITSCGSTGYSSSKPAD